MFVSAGFEARFQRAVLPALASEEELQASFKRCSSHVQESQERERAHSRVVLNRPGFGHRPQAAGPIRASVRGGAPPMSKLSGVDVHVIQYFIHSVEDTNLQIIYICLVTHDAKV